MKERETKSEKKIERTGTKEQKQEIGRNLKIGNKIPFFLFLKKNVHTQNSSPTKRTWGDQLLFGGGKKKFHHFLM